MWSSLDKNKACPESLMRCSLISLGKFAARHSRTTLSNVPIRWPLIVVVTVLSVMPVLRDNSAWEICFHWSTLCQESAISFVRERYIFASSSICSFVIVIFCPIRSNGKDREHVRLLDNGAIKKASYQSSGNTKTYCLEDSHDAGVKTAYKRPPIRSHVSVNDLFSCEWCLMHLNYSNSAVLSSQKKLKGNR